MLVSHLPWVLGAELRSSENNTHLYIYLTPHTPHMEQQQNSEQQKQAQNRTKV